MTTNAALVRLPELPTDWRDEAARRSFFKGLPFPLVVLLGCDLNDKSTKYGNEWEWSTYEGRSWLCGCFSISPPYWAWENLCARGYVDNTHVKAVLEIAAHPTSLALLTAYRDDPSARAAWWDWLLENGYTPVEPKGKA